MGLERVVEEILAKGKAEADRIVAEAKAEADAILRAAQAEADGVKKRRAAQADEAAESLRRRELASAELEAKKIRLNAERELLAAVRAAVEKGVMGLSEAERKTHMEALVASAGVEGGRVLVREEDRAIAQSLGLEVSGTFKGLGGIVVQSPDGLTTENLRYENILDDVWRDGIGEVANIVLTPKSK